MRIKKIIVSVLIGVTATLGVAGVVNPAGTAAIAMDRSCC
jgi:hypothetical protein